MRENLMTSVDNDKLYQIAKQLRCPEGENGILMGEMLSESNDGMIRKSITSLELSDRNRILELGHGSCSHLSFLMKEASDIKYFGMEISSTMVEEAERINSKYIKKDVALFQLYDGFKVPYVHNFFDKILTVNTIYFWEQPIAYLNEIYRLLKPNGIFVLAFAKGNFMENLPFVSGTDIFSLYENSQFKELLAKTNFELKDIKDQKERVKSKTGEWVDREYSIAVLTK